MQRLRVAPRKDWQAEVERLGFAYHTLDGETYWDESVAYSFSLKQIEEDRIPSAAMLAVIAVLSGTLAAASMTL